MSILLLNIDAADRLNGKGKGKKNVNVYLKQGQGRVADFPRPPSEPQDVAYFSVISEEVRIARYCKKRFAGESRSTKLIICRPPFRPIPTHLYKLKLTLNVLMTAVATPHTINIKIKKRTSRRS